MVSTKNVAVCHIISGDLWAGAEAQVFNLLQTLVKNSEIKISVICFNNGVLSRRLADVGISVNVVDEKRNGILRSVQKVSKILHLTKCNIAHVHGYKEMLVVLLAKIFSLNSIKIIRTFHGIGMLNSSQKFQVLERICALFLFHAICVSNDLKRIIISKKLLSSRKMTVFHNGICIDNYERDELIRDQLLIPRDSFVIGTIGRLVNVKGHRILIEAAKKIIQKDPHYFFVIVGDGPLFQELNDQVGKLNIRENVLLTGFKENATAIINAFDIFVLPSFHEGIPMVLLEAMRARVPIVSTNVGGISEILQNGTNSILFDPGNADELAGQCELLANKLELRNILANNAFVKVRDELNVDVLAEKMFQFYGRMVIE